jgi:hypothetical protein
MVLHTKNIFKCIIPLDFILIGAHASLVSVHLLLTRVTA